MRNNIENVISNVSRRSNVSHCSIVQHLKEFAISREFRNRPNIFKMYLSPPRFFWKWHIWNVFFSPPISESFHKLILQLQPRLKNCQTMMQQFSSIFCIQLAHIRLTRSLGKEKNRGFNVFSCLMLSYVNPQPISVDPATGTFPETIFNSSQYSQRLNTCQTIIYSATDRSWYKERGL